jgi:hypothetical protein
MTIFQKTAGMAEARERVAAMDRYDDRCGHESPSSGSDFQLLRTAMLALEAGVPLHRVQDAARHADPSTTRRYDRARDALDGHATYALAYYLAA